MASTYISNQLLPSLFIFAVTAGGAHAPAGLFGKHLAEGHIPSRYFAPYQFRMHFPGKSFTEQTRSMQEFAANPL
jgi:hypothetical protein